MRILLVVPLLAVAAAALCGCGGAALQNAEPAAASPLADGPMAVRALHAFAPPKSEIDACETFIREVLPARGVNVLILQFHYDYQFKSHPEIGGAGACGEAEVKRLLKACRESGITLVPQMNCLGHQGMPYAPRSRTLLQAYPEFDEAPHIPDTVRGQKRVKCYCPRHPKLHAVLFDLIDELAAACEATSFHVGMDEVFNIADEKCPRCGGSDPAEVFAEEVNRLHDHLAAKGITMWMWGDRLIDAKVAGVNTWESSANGTHPAIDRVPTDIVICDWHYENVPQTAQGFIEKGFRVIACPWRKTDVALGQLAQMRQLAAHPDPARAVRALGMGQTTWTFLQKFAAAYGEAASEGGVSPAKCFQQLSAAWRDEPVPARP